MESRTRLAKDDLPDSLLKGDGQLSPDYGTVICNLMTKPDQLYMALRALEPIVGKSNSWIDLFLDKSEKGWNPKSKDKAKRLGYLMGQWTKTESDVTNVTLDFQNYAIVSIELFQRLHYAGVLEDLIPDMRMAVDNKTIRKDVLPLSFESTNDSSGEFVTFIGITNGGPFGVGFDVESGNVVVFSADCICAKVECKPCKDTKCVVKPKPKPTQTYVKPKPKPTPTRPKPTPTKKVTKKAVSQGQDVPVDNDPEPTAEPRPNPTG